MNTSLQHRHKDIGTLLKMVKDGSLSLRDHIDDIYEKAKIYNSYNIWIYLLPKEEVIRKLEILENRHDKINLPLYGIPYAVKDNIDVAGLPTTAACKEFEYVATKNADVVDQLENAGALLIGKTNLDQFATGLVGTRSPYGVVKNSYHPDYISGGSSSGSAIAVALGLVSFSLGTDTAGSGRVPAGFNNLIGVKPTKGLLSTVGVVPACKSLDCVSIFSEHIEDAEYVFDILNSGHTDSCKLYKAVDSENFIFGVPPADQLHFSGNKEYETMYHLGIARLQEAGGEKIEIDFKPFRETAKLLYDGPWVAERLSSINKFYQTNRNKLVPEIRSILDGASAYSAVDTFSSLHKLESLKQEVDAIMKSLSLIFLPTSPTIYTIQQIMDKPLELNTDLGFYTNFVNLLNLCAIAVPNGFTRHNLPMGVTLVGKAHHDKQLFTIAKKFLQQQEAWI